MDNNKKDKRVAPLPAPARANFENPKSPHATTPPRPGAPPPSPRPPPTRRPRRQVRAAARHRPARQAALHASPRAARRRRRHRRDPLASHCAPPRAVPACCHFCSRVHVPIWPWAGRVSASCAARWRLYAAPLGVPCVAASRTSMWRLAPHVSVAARWPGTGGGRGSPTFHPSRSARLPRSLSCRSFWFMNASLGCVLRELSMIV